MKNRLFKSILVFVTIVLFSLSMLIYCNLRHNYIALMSSLDNCRGLASSIIDLELRKVPSTDSEYKILMEGSGKFCFMGGSKESYTWYLFHPFSRIPVKEGVDGYSSKIY